MNRESPQFIPAHLQGAHSAVRIDLSGRRRLFGIRALLLAATALVLSAGGASGQVFPGAPTGGFPGGRGGGPGGMGQERLEIVENFDADEDGVLNSTERAAARASLTGRGGGGRGGGGFGGRGGMGGGFAPASPGVALTPGEVPDHAGTDLYDTGVIRTIFLEFPEPGWEEELEAFYNTDVQIPVRATVDGVVYDNVGVRFRGNSSFSMVPAGSKRPIRLKFDLVDEDQDLEGYRTLNLLNAMNDPTFLRAVLYSEISRGYLPAPQIGFVRLVINGESWGLYLNQQQFNNDFVEDFFDVRSGARWQVPGSPNGQGGMVYLGEDIDAYRRIYEIDSRDDEERWNDLITLFRVLNQTPLDRLEEELEPILALDEVLKFLALDVVLANSDGYWTRASDYYIYQDVDGRFHLFSHDMNEGMGAGGGGPGGGRGGGGRGGGGFPGGGGGMGGGGNTQLDPLVGLNDASKPLRSRLLAVPELRERYLGYVREIAERDLDWAVLGPRVAELRTVIETEVLRDTRKLYSNEAFASGFEDAANSLRAFADARRAYLLAATGEVGQ